MLKLQTPMEKSSFLSRNVSNQDAIIQFLRPTLGQKVSQGLDVFDRLVNDCESITIQGITIRNNSGNFVLSAAEIKENLDEFDELKSIATLGRELLDKFGYVSRRQNTPMVGVSPVGASVQIQPIETQLPGQEPLQGVILSPSQKGKK